LAVVLDSLRTVVEKAEILARGSGEEDVNKGNVRLLSRDEIRLPCLAPELDSVLEDVLLRKKIQREVSVEGEMGDEGSTQVLLRSRKRKVAKEAH